MNFIKSSRSYGLILAGGGAKGAYQMGAWQAMREMHINFCAIAGVSIGAINGALIASADYKNALSLWNNVTIDKGIKIESELKDPENLFSFRNYAALFKEFVKNGGIDASPTKDYLSQYIDEEKVRESEIPFGLVTYQLSQLRPLELFIDDIPEGELIDYLLASAKFPGVSNIGPEGEWFLDGGAYDNAPISMLKKRGINRLIVVDISSIKGIAHQSDFSCANIIYIRPYDVEDLGASFDFDDEIIEKRIKFGYFDTKKAFGKLGGNIFYFRLPTFSSLVKHYGCDVVLELEELGYKVGLDRLKIYTEKEFLTSLKVLYLEKEEQLRREESEESGFIEKLKRGIRTQVSHIRNSEDYSRAIAVLDTIIV